MAEIQKNLVISLLLDFYGEMLTDKQKEVVDLYYNEDLSLAEIAGIAGITRQGVRDSIKRAEKQLLYCEEKLGLYAKFHQIQADLEIIQALAVEALEENEKLANSALINKHMRTIIEKVKKIST